MDVEQTVKFILDQQQRLGTHLERLDAHMQQLATQQDLRSEDHRRLEGYVERIAQHQERLTEDHRRLEGYVERIARNQLELAEMQSRHEERFGQLVTIVGQLTQAQRNRPRSLLPNDSRTCDPAHAGGMKFPAIGA